MKKGNLMLFFVKVVAVIWSVMGIYFIFTGPHDMVLVAWNVNAVSIWVLWAVLRATRRIV